MNIHNVNIYLRRSIIAGACFVVYNASLAQSASLFGPGTILVSRTTYTGTSTTVPFPGLLPNNAASTSDGTFPSVFNNETPDASFGVTAPIFIDQLTRTGALISTVPLSTVVSTNLSTSFPSKSELGLSVTPNGSGITFMAYGAPTNSLDVSNANTPGHVDITNPVNGQGILIYQRDIVELSASGAAQVTTTNAYSGNNGRNVVLGANGNYYTVGNAGNNGKSVTLATGTVTLASGSANVSLSGASTTTNLYAGAPFSGTNVPTGTYIASITDTTHFTISAAATGAAAGAYIANAGAVQLVSTSFSSGATTITVASTSTLVPGMPLTGAGFAAGSYIQSITDATHFVSSAATTANSGSGSYTASVSNSMLSDDTGVQMIQKGANDTTGTGTGNVDAQTFSTVVGRVNGTYGSGTGYERGFTITQIGAAADKSGKDDNFRGLTNYNNTLYVSKGSGGNGFDAVYQVNPSGGAYVAPGTSAGLPTSANAATASINPLPGWPTTSTGANESKTLTTPIVYHPFGIWFANDTTLYVADEGATGVTNAAPGGLEKWVYNTGTSQWELKYTLAASTIPSYNVGGIGTLNAVGLRNITGVQNGDGTVTIYGITSTGGQTLNDEGADPNQLVSITDTLAATSLPAESFTVLETAAYGDALRGVVYFPTIAPTVTFTGAPSTASYGSVFTVSATTNASTTPTITAGGACTISGNTVIMISSAGTCNLTATWAGDSTYNPATATQTTSAIPAVLTVTANNVSRPYGTANPTLTATITGFVNSDPPSVVSGSPALATTATTASLPGAYPITVGVGTLTAANYSFALVNGTLTVTQAQGLTRVVGAGGSNLVSDLVNAATGALGQGQVVGGPFSLVASDPGGRFVYVAGGTTLYGATIDSGNGALTPIPGFPYTLPGAITAVTEDASGRFVYVGSSSGVSGASIDPGTGALTLIPGSPFAVSGGVNALASDAAGKYLFAAGANEVTVLAIDGTSGALTPIAGSPFAVSNNGTTLAVDRQNRFLFVSDNGSNGIAGYAINGTTGALTALAGSPFFPGAGSLGLSFDGSGKFLYALQSSPRALWGFAVDGTTGNLAPIPGAPFVCACNGVTADASGKYVYAIDDFGVLAYQIDSGTGVPTFINGINPGGNSIALAPAAGSATATLQSLQILPANPTAASGSNQQFTATGTFSDGTQRFLTGSVTWSSSTAGVATISNALGQNGLATATGSGSTTITATLNGVTATTTLTVP